MSDPTRRGMAACVATFTYGGRTYYAGRTWVRADADVVLQFPDHFASPPAPFGRSTARSTPPEPRVTREATQRRVADARHAAKRERDEAFWARNRRLVERLDHPDAARHRAEHAETERLIAAAAAAPMEATLRELCDRDGPADDPYSRNFRRPAWARH
jgi:hypothetical protein